MTLVPRLDILPAPQRALWPELATLPQGFVLYDGTALALRLAHRESVDFDFFSHDPLDHRALDASAEFLAGAITLQQEPNARTVLVRRAGGEVKISLFGDIAFGRVGAPDTTADGVLRVASLLDLAGTKIKALLQRVEAKDYRDIAALLGAGVSLDDILGAASALFGPSFNPLVARKAVSYFEGGDLETLDASIRAQLVAAAMASLDTSPIAKRAPRLD